jgi:S-adenosylmethionine:diacylglycerol 3-amino-3-carboxypropyl transferase
MNNSGNSSTDEGLQTKEYDMTSHNLARKEDCSAPRLIGVSRAADSDRAYLVTFDRRLTDTELADIHDEIHRYMQARKAVVLMHAPEVQQRKIFDPTLPPPAKGDLFL